MLFRSNIRNKSDYQRSLPIESDNSEYRLQVVEKNVPVSAIYIGFLMCDRMDISYYGYDLISDVLSRGDSSRLNQSLVKDKQIMTSVNAYITGSVDQGMFIISGKVSEGFSLEEAEKAIFEELHALPNVSERELQKVKNKVVSSSKFEEVGALNKAMNLSYYELLGDANNANYQNDFYEAVSLLQFKKLASELFQYQNANVLHYKAIGQ